MNCQAVVSWKTTVFYQCSTSSLVVNSYMTLMNEYLFHAGDNIKIIQNQSYYVFIIKRGLATLKHIFNTYICFNDNTGRTFRQYWPATIYYYLLLF